MQPEKKYINIMKRFLLTIICVVAVIFTYAEGNMTFKENNAKNQTEVESDL
jgi:hypothetical protein